MLILDADKAPTIEVQHIPGRSGFNDKPSKESSVLSVVGYCPVIDASSTQYDVVYIVMDGHSMHNYKTDQANTCGTRA